ncbi:MAG TPA: TetR family transcriptional regulator [Feifaniaceae bacterium]|nr:TetR family transcriptional regulator [Feifaniaceae bacterium]
MPTRTFFNLPEEKRQKLLDAIHEELSRVPLDEVSINHIIRLAHIPRGSFYQYFKDKQDMLQYLMSDYRYMIKDRALASLKQSGGDLFLMLLDVLDATYAFVTGEKHNEYFKNVFSDIRWNAVFLQRHADGGALGELMNDLLPFIDMASLDIRSEEDFDDMLSALRSLTGQAYAKMFLDISGYEKSRLRYAAQLELLKRGFLKAKKTEP